MEKVKCSECGTEFDETKKKCPKCGSKVTDKLTFTCGNCGTTVSDNTENCPECGAKFVKDQDTVETFKRIAVTRNKYEKTIYNLEVFNIVYLTITIILAFVLIAFAIHKSDFISFIFAIIVVITGVITYL